MENFIFCTVTSMALFKTFLCTADDILDLILTTKYEYNYQKITVFTTHREAYLGVCQMSMTKLFAKIINSCKSLVIFAEKLHPR